MTTRFILLLGAAALVLAGCGGGSPVATRLTGTVATGAPMAKAQVEVKDKNNEKATAKVGDDGRYEVDIANMAAPFIAQAKGYVGGQPTTYYALLRAVPDSHVLNITQTTDAVARNAGIDSAEVFKTPALLSNKVDFDKVKRVAERLASALKNYFEAVGLKSTSGETLDVTTTKFAADKVDPVDRLLECLSYDAAKGTLTVKSFCSSGAAAATTVDLKTPTPAALPAPSAAGAETLGRGYAGTATAAPNDTPTQKAIPNKGKIHVSHQVRGDAQCLACLGDFASRSYFYGKLRLQT